jgi:hypothetical protein
MLVRTRALLFGHKIVPAPSEMSKTKKRSRFARSSEVAAESVFKIDEYADDYMAPVEQLLSNADVVPPAIKGLGEIPGKKSKVSLQTLMDESREKSMAVPISSSNIGFKMLKKFGFNEGEGLGKESKGIVEPIVVQKRDNKDISGLGVLEKRDRVQKTLLSIKNHNIATRDELLMNFKNNKASQQKTARSIGDMKKAQKVIYELDEQAAIPVHELTASLHIRYEAFSSSRTLEVVVRENNSRLSSTVYDRYSGMDTIDTALEDDLHTHDTHTASAHSTIQTTSVPTDAPTDPSLEDCLCYLREVHYYCYYCGAGYNDTDDLLNNCPGLYEEDH